MESSFNVEALEPFIDSRKAAEFLGLSAITVRRMARAGRLPSIAFPSSGAKGRIKYRFRYSDLTAFLKSLERRPQVA